MKHRMPPCNWMDLVVYLLGFTLIVSNSDAKANFTSTPPNIVYASQGDTAILTWKYTVENRVTEFQDRSPTWHLYLVNRTVIQLAYENKDTRLWNLSVECPSRLRSRLNITNSNSLVIRNVGLDDSGTYGCILNLTNGKLLTSRAKLVVTETPKFATPLPQTQVVREGQDLSINCSSYGNPTPVIKWVRFMKGKKVPLYSQGTGSAVLNIFNIRREENGTYECQASNNPTIIVRNQTDVLVEYRPSIDSSTSSPISINSWDNHTVSLRCMASGNPRPQVTWSGPDKRTIKYGVSPLRGGSLLIIQTKYKTDYGQYRCRASNSQGYVYGFISVKRIVVPQPPVLLEATSALSSIEIKWKRPTLDGGSEIIDYHVSINTEPSRGVSIKGTSLIIAGLTKATKYQVQITARNIVGYSNETSRYISTKSEDGTIDEQISGSVVLGICLPIIFILLLVIVVILVYNWWKRRKRKDDYTQPESESLPTGGKTSIEVDEIALDEGHTKQNGTTDTSQKEYTGSCFQPFYIKRQKRRPGKAKQPRPVVILESISEENADEETTEESPQKKQDKNDNDRLEESASGIIENFCEGQSTEAVVSESSPA